MVSPGAVTHLGAQSAERSASTKGPKHKSFSTLSTACLREKEPDLESLCNLQVTGV